MNLAKQLDTKSILRNQRHSCTPTMKHQKQKSGRKIPFDIATRKQTTQTNQQTNVGEDAEKREP